RRRVSRADLGPERDRPSSKVVGPTSGSCEWDDHGPALLARHDSLEPRTPGLQRGAHFRDGLVAVVSANDPWRGVRKDRLGHVLRDSHLPKTRSDRAANVTQLEGDRGPLTNALHMLGQSDERPVANGRWKEPFEISRRHLQPFEDRHGP